MLHRAKTLRSRPHNKATDNKVRLATPVIALPQDTESGTDPEIFFGRGANGVFGRKTVPK